MQLFAQVEKKNHYNEWWKVTNTNKKLIYKGTKLRKIIDEPIITMLKNNGIRNWHPKASPYIHTIRDMNISQDRWNVSTNWI
jgi:hypothetical protein